MILPASCQPGIAAGIAALQSFYNLSTGLWNTTGWWNAANALETTIDYVAITDTIPYRGVIFQTYERQKNGKFPQFINRWFNDDDGWWALAWIKAYDLTGETRYLEAAKTIFRSMAQSWDNTCGGGIWWKKDRTYKNAITNALFLSVAVRLHLRSSTAEEKANYLDWANRTWAWWQQTGMINGENLVNDGLDDRCRNNGKTTWTYNQGVILGGLVDLYRATGDRSLVQQAEAIADAALLHLAPKGILQEPCEAQNDCGNDGPQFKGIFIRNLAYLYQTVPKPTYREFILRNANAIWANRNADNQFGLQWDGPLDRADAARQSSAMDAINAAIALQTRGQVYQAEEAHRTGFSLAGGYVTGEPDNDQTLTFTVTVACSGYYSLKFRYSALNGAARYLVVNGRNQRDNFLFPKTQTWQDWQDATVARVWLNQGSNQISLVFNPSKGSRDRVNLDQLVIF